MEQTFIKQNLFYSLLKTLFFIIILAGCSAPVSRIQYSVDFVPVKDLANIPQQGLYFIKNSSKRIVPEDAQLQMAEFYRRKVLSVWDGEVESYDKEYAFWPAEVIKENHGYGENYRIHSETWVRSLLDNANADEFPNLNWSGVVVNRVDLRALPTHRPRFSRPDGFPFDSLQNSSLWPGTPVQVLHESRDKRWLFVAAAHAGGWLPKREVLPVDSVFRQVIEDSQWVVVKRDRIPLESDNYTVIGRTGMTLPLLDFVGDTFVVGIPVNKNGKAAWQRVAVKKNGGITLFPTEMTERNAAEVLSFIAGQPYGWGGLFGHRDCSATIRDYFAVFGIWLPRNSSKQIIWGETTDLSDYTNDKKITLVKKAEPWKTLVGMDGHIMLYVGDYEGKPVVFHNLWGLPVKKLFSSETGRLVIGEAVFTTLKPGAERRDVRRSGSLLVDRVHSLGFPVTHFTE